MQVRKISQAPVCNIGLQLKRGEVNDLLNRDERARTGAHLWYGAIVAWGAKGVLTRFVCPVCPEAQLRIMRYLVDRICRSTLVLGGCCIPQLAWLSVLGET